jgi:hypothetical protein
MYIRLMKGKKQIWKELPEWVRYVIVGVLTLVIAMLIINLLGFAGIIYQGSR